MPLNYHEELYRRMSEGEPYFTAEEFAGETGQTVETVMKGIEEHNPWTTPRDQVKEMPSMTVQVSGLLQAGKSFIASGFAMASEELAGQRWEICQGCDQLALNRCRQCGCYMKVKVKLETSKCPIGKW